MYLKKDLKWMVLGAGPAGIAAIGKLLDQGIAADQIGWMDPYFQVGDFGRKWGEVSSNTQVELFLKFLFHCQSFVYKDRPKKFLLDTLNPKETCLLKHVTEPLQWITDHLRRKIHSFQQTALSLSSIQGDWIIKTDTTYFSAKNVILAIGAEEKTLPLTGPEIIPLSTALDLEKLKKIINPEDRVAVFGSSHSAVLILANLTNLSVKKIVNFYQKPLQYALYLEDWVLFDNTGLKGFAAEWARKHLDGKHPLNLSRMLSSDHTFDETFSVCNKVIYAVGFERRKTPILEQFEGMQYNDRTGIIAPGLFGVGIAFPQAQFDPLMNLEYRVGLWKFMDYLNTILPIWIKYANQ